MYLSSLNLLPDLELIDYFWNKEGKHKQGQDKNTFKGNLSFILLIY